jgi:hypothetical protein
MNNFKKQLFFILFTLSACLLAFSGVSAQTWTGAATSSNGNPCVAVSNSSPSAASLMLAGDQGQCSCPQGYTYGKAVNANCTMSGFIPGCWNPNNGTCNTCGSGGTITLAANSCFSNGQANSGGNGAGNPPMGVTCVSTGGAYSTQCISSGTNSGGYSTN